MFDFDRAITVGSKVWDIAFAKRKKGSKKFSPINKTARTGPGRLAIATALEVFYLNFGNENGHWFSQGVGQKTKAPIGVVLAAEAVYFAAKNHQYSKTVACKK